MLVVQYCGEGGSRQVPSIGIYTQDTEFLLSVSQGHFPRGPCPELVKPRFSPNVTRGWVATSSLLRVSSTPFFSASPTLLQLLPTPPPSFIPQYPKGPHPQTEGIWVWAGRFQGFCLPDKQCGVRMQVQISAPWGARVEGINPRSLGSNISTAKRSMLLFHTPNPTQPLPPPLFKAGSSDMPSCLPCASLTSSPSGWE